ncbi:alpha-amylase [Boletus reticuloceps]|uniref:alpha-amylase n=1 Tax=Boletus reticuloceps TaxID=495285 RepID=A0A8I3AE42_9AGAM|nr:alpha-amylase [Boletus reticuloceps]
MIVLLLLQLIPLVLAADANDWRGRSIYQVIIDRYALPGGADPTRCDPGKRTWCGGTWSTLRQNLDYIQDAGFTAVWISPVSQNYQGPTTPYGDAYHGYWVADATKLNDRFGTSDDLKSLSRELHNRGMYLMVDVVVNDVMATSTNPDLSTYMFKNESQFHPYCVMDWSSATSQERCWLGDTIVPLADINTEDPTVVSAFQDWIQSLVLEYSIDGLRIDAFLPTSPNPSFIDNRHVNMDFWPGFCAAAGVFCIGEVFTTDIDDVAAFQGPDALDSVLNYPMYGAIVNAFTIPGPQNITALTDMIAQSKQKYEDCGLLGNFIENQDNPRWHNISVDPQSLYRSNRHCSSFLSVHHSIPIVYYGQEQGFSGSGDPWNREPLWTSGYANTTAYQLMSTMNQFRNFLVNSTNWVNSSMQVLAATNDSIAILKGNVISVLTNIGSPPKDTGIPVYTPFPTDTPLINILTCIQWPVGSNGTIDVEYAKGGVPVVLIPMNDLQGSGLCGYNNTLMSGADYASGVQEPHRSSFGVLRLLLSLVSANLLCMYFW